MKSPNQIPGLKVWLDASDSSTINDGRLTTDGVQVEKWVDKIAGYGFTSGSGPLGNLYNSTAPNPTLTYKKRGPTYSVGRINGKNSILFGYYKGPTSVGPALGDANTEDNQSFRRLACGQIPVIGSGTYSQFIVFLPTDDRLQTGRSADSAPLVEVQQNTEIVFSVLDASRAFPTLGAIIGGSYPGTYVERQLTTTGIRPTNTVRNGTIGYIDATNENSAERLINPSLPIGTFAGFNYDVEMSDGPDSNKSITDKNNSLYQYGKVNIFVCRYQGQRMKKLSVVRSGQSIKDHFLPKYNGSSTAIAPFANNDRRASSSTRIANPIMTIGCFQPGYGLSVNAVRHQLDGGSANKGGGAQPYEGHFCEFLFWDRILTDSETNAVISYLKNKWIG